MLFLIRSIWTVNLNVYCIKIYQIISIHISDISVCAFLPFYIYSRKIPLLVLSMGFSLLNFNLTEKLDTVINSSTLNLIFPHS